MSFVATEGVVPYSASSSTTQSISSENLVLSLVSFVVDRLDFLQGLL